jgi:hypothetical protein
LATSRKRDYAAEYARRLKRALDKGYSRSVARGHAKKGEISIARARKLGVNAGGFITGKGRHGTPNDPFRPTYAAIKKRLKQLGLPLSGAQFRGKKGLIPIAWTGPRGHRGKDGKWIRGGAYLKDDDTRDGFIEYYTDWGLSEHEAYTLWFSP